MNEIARPASVILDEYCRYYSDFSKHKFRKIVNIYIKNLYPQIKYQFDQLLNASFHVWHNLSDDEKISLGTFIEQINNNQDTLPTCNYPLKRTMSITPYKIFLKDQRRQMRRKHSTMSTKEINQRLAKRWKNLSKRMKQIYQNRSNLAKKRISHRLLK